MKAESVKNMGKQSCIQVDRDSDKIYFTPQFMYTQMIMPKNQRIILYILILIAGASWIILSANTTNITIGGTSAPQAGFAAPDFTLKTPTGETYTLSGLRGQAVLVNLWATWCPPCRAEMPAIDKMYQEYKGRGFIVLAIDMTYQDNPMNVIPFTQEYGLTFPILLEETGDVASLYQLRSLPSSYFINRAGVIQEVVIGGPMSEALLRTRIEQILK
jgi:cytochrome c biogenesis protein CcmG/thiol:disulfide interchange protein DsbE